MSAPIAATELPVDDPTVGYRPYSIDFSADALHLVSSSAQVFVLTASAVGGTVLFPEFWAWLPNPYRSGVRSTQDPGDFWMTAVGWDAAFAFSMRLAPVSADESSWGEINASYRR